MKGNGNSGIALRNIANFFKTYKSEVLLSESRKLRIDFCALR